METHSFPAVTFKEGRSSRIKLDETGTEQATGTDTGRGFAILVEFAPEFLY